MDIHTLHANSFHTKDSRVFKVEKLNLNLNYITKLHNEQFNTLLLLKNISLRSNIITEISSSVFSKNKNIEHIDLYDNKITIFNFNLGELKSLRILNLGYNKLNTLMEKLFKDFTVKDNTVVVIYKNRLKCDCSMLWVRQLDKSNIGINSSNYDICSAGMSRNISVSCFMLLKSSDKCNGVIHEDQCNNGNICNYIYT